MGPPLKAAENRRLRARRRGSDRRFNGAAAKSSGKFALLVFLIAFARICFNGAAAKSSGKYDDDELDRSCCVHASMGPPLKAAENASSRAARA